LDPAIECLLLLIVTIVVSVLDSSWSRYGNDQPLQ
jgi:hypothetical protein